MKIVFRGNPLDVRDTQDVCRTAGKVFVKGQPVDVSDLPADLQRRLAGNHHFQVVDGVPAADKPKRGRPRKVQEDSDAGSDADT